MSKNMTRKGLAIGAASALVVAGFSGFPANAAGLADTSFVSLTPTTGTEYAVQAANGITFSLSANEASTVSTGDLKFLVTDPNSLIEPTIATEGRQHFFQNDAVIDIPKEDGPEVTITDDDTAALLKTGDQIYFVNDFIGDEGDGDGTDDDVIIAKNKIVTVTVDGNDIKFTTDVDFSGLAAAGANETISDTDSESTFQVIREARTTTGADAGTYVIDSGQSDATNTEDIVLATATANTTSVTVQAWMDANDNDTIDSTEYTSPVRTITWVKPSEITAVTALTPVVGSQTLDAVITTTPVLNGNQVLAQDDDFINAQFQRSSSAAKVFADDTDTSNGTTTVTSVWDDTDKNFTVSVSMDADAANEADDADGNSVADTWDDIAAPTAGGTILESIQISTSGVVSAVTTADHKMVSGDKITMTIDADTAVAFKALAAETAAVVTVTGAKTFTYKVSETTGLPTTATAVLEDIDQDDYVVVTYAGNTGLRDRVGPETYTVQAAIAGTLQGNIVSTGVVAAAAATTSISTAASSTVQGKTFTAVGTNTTKVLAGTTSVPVTVTVLDADGDAVSAGRPVALALTSTGSENTDRVNGKTADTVMTDANGQVSATVTVATGVAGVKVALKATAENAAEADIDLEWEAASFGLVDLTGTGGTLADNSTTKLDIIKLGSYTRELMVADQWFNAPSSDVYRLNITGEGVVARYVNLVNGRATLTATDTGVFGASMDADVLVEKLASDGVTVASKTTHNFNAALSDAYSINVGAAGATLYGNAVVASVAVAKKGLVEIDKRVDATATPAYANNLVLNGSVIEKATSAGQEGATVTVSGPSNILFEEGQVAKRGSLTFLAGTDGKFEVKAYSTTAQTDSVVTFTTSDGATGTIKVTFTGIGVGEGTSLVVTTPAAVKPASTFQVKAKLADVYGNGVDTAAGRVKVTYTGAGIVFGTLPTETDANGELQFSVLLGSNDTGTVSVTVSYDQNGDADYVDAKDLTTTSTTEITASGVASSEQKVNAGSFKGYVALYAKGYAGQRMSAKVGKDWVVVPALASDFERVVEFTGAGVDVAVRIYIDRVLVDTINLTTK